MPSKNNNFLSVSTVPANLFFILLLHYNFLFATKAQANKVWTELNAAHMKRKSVLKLRHGFLWSLNVFIVACQCYGVVTDVTVVASCLLLLLLPLPLHVVVDNSYLLKNVCVGNLFILIPLPGFLIHFWFWIFRINMKA